ncbi:hypothetical protein [Botrimarina sp.]|uniref:hypothetical protein n=1 Tax=Botrimarina sp. TaxID=2795802 RepID=UPI0032EDF072
MTATVDIAAALAPTEATQDAYRDWVLWIAETGRASDDPNDLDELRALLAALGYPPQRLQYDVDRCGYRQQWAADLERCDAWQHEIDAMHEAWNAASTAWCEAPMSERTAKREAMDRIYGDRKQLVDVRQSLLLSSEGHLWATARVDPETNVPVGDWSDWRNVRLASEEEWNHQRECLASGGLPLLYIKPKRKPSKANSEAAHAGSIR